MAPNDQVRWKQRFENFQLALEQLSRACNQEEYSQLELSGLIKTFELAFETAWKTLKDLLAYEGFDINSPRAAIRQAYSSGIIAEPEQWLEALESRNILSHSYDQATARGAATLIKYTYLPMLITAMKNLKARMDSV
jgi:nucleotidyltransferase substrate binding protein (TIGR01987 family)